VKRVVLDTNVLISGLLSPDNPPGQIIDGLRRERIQLTLDDRIFAEYSKVIWRPKFDRFIQPEEREWILDYIFNHSQRLVSEISVNNLPDPKDAAFLEIAATAQVPLVTGNLKHYPNEKRRGVKVLSPAEYILWW
jgi:putative PIN family toxin of toxin-antitoxin system